MLPFGRPGSFSAGHVVTIAKWNLLWESAQPRRRIGKEQPPDVGPRMTDLWLYLALSDQAELAERAPSPRSQVMTLSCWVLCPLAVSSGVPWA
jgi:hypothetical protein